LARLDGREKSRDIGMLTEPAEIQHPETPDSYASSKLN